MKHIHILYIGTDGDWNFQKVLATRYSVQVCSVLTDSDFSLADKKWDLIIVHNSWCFMQDKALLKKLIKYPLLFISSSDEIGGYLAPLGNLFGVIHVGRAALSALGIPQEMQVHLSYPVEKVADHYLYEEQPNPCRIVYCPTGQSVVENDLKLFRLLRNTNASLTIVSDAYGCVKSALPPSAEIVSRRSLLSVLKKAHLVVASGYDAIRAMGLCKPCIVLGNYGLGGMVDTANYDHLQSVAFGGRKGASFGEMVPMDLLESEIKKALAFNSSENVHAIQERVCSTYNLSRFKKDLFGEIERILHLAAAIKSKKRRLLLKPLLSSVFAVEELEGKKYLVRGMTCFGEIDDEMDELLKQCDGTATIQDLVQRNGYEPEDAVTLWENLYELWNEKLILFAI